MDLATYTWEHVYVRHRSSPDVQAVGEVQPWVLEATYYKEDFSKQ